MGPALDGLTLDQLSVFVTIVEEGSFSAAARRVGRTQSAITYGVQNLELQTGMQLFDRTGYRPVLTPAGIALLPRARRVLDAMGDFRSQAHSITEGIETRLGIAIETTAPTAPMIDILSEFHRLYPNVEVSILRAPLNAAVDAVRDGRSDLGIVADPPIAGFLDDMVRAQFGTLSRVVVASADHPLARLPSPLLENDLQVQMQVLLSPGSDVTGTNDFGAHAVNRWRTNDLEIRHRMILAGLGWGGLPRHMVEDDILSGRLVVLELDGSNAANALATVPLSVIHLKSTLPGPAARWLLQRLVKTGCEVEG